MARIFLALTPGKDLNDQIIELKKGLKNSILSEAEINWQKNDDHHITVNFVGSMEPEQIEEMYEAGDEIIGEYNFEFTGNVESGDSTFQCDRQDPNVTIGYSIELEWVEVNIVEWNGGSLF